MEKDQSINFVFPALFLHERDFRNLSAFLPRLNILGVVRPPVAPSWAGGRLAAQPVFRDPEFLAQVKSCIQGYRSFAEVHGGSGGTLGYLSQLLEETDDSRFKIQEQLRGKGPSGLEAGQMQILRAAVFLEIARELDERETELEAGYSQVDKLEKQFRQILGISDEDEEQEVSDPLSPSLTPEDFGPRYMLAERIESWFRLFATLPSVGDKPVFVATNQDIVDETIDLIRAKSRGTGREIAASKFRLGSFPRLDLLGEKQFRSLIEAPTLLAAYQEELQAFLLDAASGANREKLEAGGAALRQALEKSCKSCDVSGTDQASISLTLPHSLTVGDILDVFSPPGGPTGGDVRNRPALFLCLEY